MIGTKQERDALMAAIQTHASACANVIGALENGNDKEAEKWEELADTEMDAIRSMLAPDDAVIRERIAEAVRETVTHYVKQIAWPDEDDRAAFCEDIESDLADQIIALLRGEATR